LRPCHLHGASSNEGEYNGDDVDRQLELEELGDVVVDVSPPHHRLDDAREVIIGQHDIRRFLCHVRTRDALHRPSV